jgi:hypothetical protein
MMNRISNNQTLTHFWMSELGFLLSCAVVALISGAGFCSKAHRSRASTTEPANTVAAFYSPFMRAPLAALISSRMLSRNDGSVMKSKSVVPTLGMASGHFASACRINVTGFRCRNPLRPIKPPLPILCHSRICVLTAATFDTNSVYDCVQHYQFGWDLLRQFQYRCD